MQQELCAWCLDNAGLVATSGQSHGICSQHAEMQLAKLAARRRASVKTVNFVLVASEPEPEPLYFPFVNHENRPCYPANWSKASYVLRRSVGFRCEQCGSSVGTATHHKGIDYANGKRGNPHDKHDLRRENLIVLCQACHDKADMAQGCKRRRRR